MSIPNSVQDKVRRFDSALFLKELQGPDPNKPGQSCTMIALFRKNRSGVFERIGWVRPDLLGDGTVLLNKLSRNDVRQYGSGAKAADAYDQVEQKEKDQRHEERKDRFLEIGKAGYDHIKRRAGERVQNAGIPGAA